jgi:hypothetical protein
MIMEVGLIRGFMSLILASTSWRRVNHRLLADWVAAKSTNRIIRAVLNGLTGPITVNGQAFNNTMVAWGPSLKDEEIAAVLSFVRQNKEWGNNAPPVTAEQVKAIRAKIADHSQPFTPDELLKISEDQ